MEKVTQNALTREAYGKALAELGDEYMFYVLDADLAGSTNTEIFRKKFPERFIECGIAEANMVNVGAGIASTGIPVFVSSYAIFMAGRCYEQIRTSVTYPHLNVKIGATHGGVTVGEDGASHQCCEDFALMRSIPGMVVICPCDAIEARLATKAALLYNGPVYLRFSRSTSPIIYDKPYNFEIGKGVVLEDGKDIAIFTTGIMASVALEAKAKLKTYNIDCAVINIHTIKPIDQNLIIQYANKCHHLFTLEEHSIIGGLGSSVAEVLVENKPTPLKRIGTNDVFGTSGKPEQMFSYFGLDCDSVVKTILATLNK